MLTMPLLFVDIEHPVGPGDDEIDIIFWLIYFRETHADAEGRFAGILLLEERAFGNAFLEIGDDFIRIDVRPIRDQSEFIAAIAGSEGVIFLLFPAQEIGKIR